MAKVIEKKQVTNQPERVKAFRLIESITNIAEPDSL
jgi:hypothetical protein